MDSTVQIGLVVLIYTTAILLTLITIFLIKLIYTINSIAKNADNQINRVKGAFENFMCVPFRVGQKMRGLFEGLREGLSAGIKLFRK